MMISAHSLICLAVTFQAVKCIPFDVPVDELDSSSKPSLETLQFVAVVTRHGSRSPWSTYPNDPYPYYNKMFWPNGHLELTSYGKRQLFRTGENLRRRYSGFLPVQFYPSDTVVEYNNNNRDFGSGACTLAGLYPPVENQIWNPDLLWQPIPMYMKQYDPCALTSGNECPSVKAESEALTSKLDLEISSKGSVIELLKNISLHAGSNITYASQLGPIHDALTMQYENGFKLPSWTKDYFPEPITSIHAPLSIVKLAGSENLLNMIVGPELKHVSDMLNMKANRIYPKNKKLYIEAAHDCTIIAILKALGNKDPYLEVRTSAYMIFELHYISPSHILQVLHYNNSSDTNPEYINITGCPSPCSLEDFTKLVDKINPSKWKERCANKN